MFQTLELYSWWNYANFLACCILDISVFNMVSKAKEYYKGYDTVFKCTILTVIAFFKNVYHYGKQLLNCILFSSNDISVIITILIYFFYFFCGSKFQVAAIYPWFTFVVETKQFTRVGVYG